MPKRAPLDPEKLKVPMNKEATETLLAIITSKNQKAAVEMLGISEVLFYARLKKYPIREHIAKIPQDALNHLQAKSLQAAEILTDDLEIKDRRIRHQAAIDVFDRTVDVGKKTQTNIQVNVMPILGGAARVPGHNGDEQIIESSEAD